MVTVGGIIGGGLRLVRDRPVSTLIWGIVYVAVTAASMIAVFAPFLQMAMANAQNPALADPTAAFRMMGMMYLLDFGILIVMTILMNAGIRAVLRPDEPGFAYIRLGMDEVRAIGLMLVLVIGMFILVFILSLVLMIVLGTTIGMAGGFGQGSTPGAGVFLLFFVILAIPTFIGVRLSPALALTMIREKIVIGEAWRLTSGSFWKIFAGFLVLGLILVIAYFFIAIAVLFPMGAMVQSGGPAAAAELMQGHFGGLLPIFIGGGLIMTILAGIGIAFWSGGIAAATNELLDDPGIDYAETFA